MSILSTYAFTLLSLLVVPALMALTWLWDNRRSLALPLPRWPERLLPAHDFRVRVRWAHGTTDERIVRVRGLTQRRAWVKLLERPTHPEVTMRMVGPV